MPYYQQSLDFNLSTSFSSHRRFYATEHFKWKSIKRFIYIAYAFSASGINYDIFSRICDNVRLLDFLICEFTIGMSYMFMDVFIRQYTRKIDFNSSLNPLLKGLTYGVLLQSVLWSLLHSTDLADSGLFLVASLRTPPGWSRCQRIGLNITCVSTKEVLNRCYFHSNITNFSNTSAHVFYQKHFKHQDNKNDFPRKIFIFGLIWFFNFLYVTVPDDIILKMLTVTFFWRIYSTLIVLFVLLLSFVGSTDQILKIETKAFLTNIFDISSPSSFTDSMDHVAYAFRIGLVGVFDFGTMSPYTMVDNAVLIFTVLYTLCAFARSLIVKIMYTTLTNCVKVEICVTHHYMLFAVLPLGTDFFSINRFYVFAIYLNKLLGAKASLLTLTLTISKLIHSEFRSVKNIYIIGGLCFIGFSFTFTISLLTGSRMQGVMYGLNVIVLYLGGFKVAVVMWIYGVQRFSTDIQFWLGFKPTKFWRICWSFTPVVLFISVGVRIYSLIHIRDLAKMIYAVGWITLSLLIVYIIQIRTIIRYIIRNTLASILSSSAKYGPPDSEDRKRRKSYSETLYLRHCRHNCNVVDDMVDCNHLPLRSRNRSDLSSDSFKSIYEAGPSKHSPSIEESHSSSSNLR